MKKISFLLLLVCFIICSRAQNIFPATGSTGIGTVSPNASAILEIKSTTQGVLFPRMTKNQRNAIAAPAAGLMIYQTNSTPGLYYYTGSAWVAPKTPGWSLTGNDHTMPGSNFIGTTDAQPLMFKVNNSKSGYIDFDGTKANTGFGFQSLFSNSGGIFNTATGYQSLFFNSFGTQNTANGYQALYSNTSGSFNTANGYYALSLNTIGGQNTAYGSQALYNNTEGSDNVAIGKGALYSINTGTANTAVGTACGPTVDPITNWTGIGYFVGGNSSVSNSVEIGNNAVTSIKGEVSFSTYSDGRIKDNIKADVPGLAFINRLRPVTYNLNIHRQNEMMNKGKNVAKDWAGRYDIEKKNMTGFVAQEVEQAAKDSKYDFSGVDKPSTENGLYGLRYSDFVVPLVKAVQELSTQNDSLKKQASAQEKINVSLQKQIDDLKKILLSVNQNNTTAVANLQNQNINFTGATLEQNTPNPFSGTTAIHYILPQKFSTAQIIITDKSGRALKQINVTGKGAGYLNIDAATLSSGAYNYALYVDGKLVGSKQMILTK